MQVLDLFNNKFEQDLHEGAVDQLEQHRIDVLNDRMQELLARARESRYRNDPVALASLKQQYQKIKDERDSYYKIREAQKGQDVVDRTAKMKALTPAKPGMTGAIKDVAKGLKDFLQGRPETGPTYEGQKKKFKEVDEDSRPRDLTAAVMIKKARAAHPIAKNDAEALALYIADKEARDVARLEKENERENDMIDKLEKENKRDIFLINKLADLDKNLQKQIDQLTKEIKEGWSDKHNPTPYAVYIDGRQWKEFANNDIARAVAEKVRKSLQAQGREQQVTIAPAESYLKKNVSEQQVQEKWSEKYKRSINCSNPKGFSQRAHCAGRKKNNENVTEDKDTSAVEGAILRRIMVSHKDWLMQYGLQKIVQAAEEVAYNVGDVDEIGTSDVSAYVDQVGQILGARP